MVVDERVRGKVCGARSSLANLLLGARTPDGVVLKQSSHSSLAHELDARIGRIDHLVDAWLVGRRHRAILERVTHSLSICLDGMMIFIPRRLARRLGQANGRRVGFAASHQTILVGKWRVDEIEAAQYVRLGARALVGKHWPLGSRDGPHVRLDAASLEALKLALWLHWPYHVIFPRAMERGALGSGYLSSNDQWLLGARRVHRPRLGQVVDESVVIGTRACLVLKVDFARVRSIDLVESLRKTHSHHRRVALARLVPVGQHGGRVGRQRARKASALVGNRLVATHTNALRETSCRGHVGQQERIRVCLARLNALYAAPGRPVQHGKVALHNSVARVGRISLGRAKGNAIVGHHLVVRGRHDGLRAKLGQVEHVCAHALIGNAHGRLIVGANGLARDRLLGPTLLRAKHRPLVAHKCSIDRIDDGRLGLECLARPSGHLALAHDRIERGLVGTRKDVGAHDARGRNRQIV